MRHIYVGDIQGCREELEVLLDKIRFDPAADRLEPVGDYVNRGPDSLGVLRLLRSLSAGGVLGNHDVHLLRVAAGQREARSEDTLDELLRAPDRDNLLGWLRDRPFCKELPGVLLVHAGLHPRWENPVRELRGLDPHERHASARFATSVRCCAEDGTLADEEAPGFPPWFEHWRGRDERTIVFGHWARRGLVAQPGFRGLDTACVWGGRLTAWIAEEDRFVHVPAARRYAIL